MKSVTLLDGAVGTSLWAKAEREGYPKDPVWKYNVEHPELVRELCGEYAAAGAQIVLANTFGANRYAVKRSSDYTVEQVVSSGVREAKAALSGTGVRVALSVGPLPYLLEPYGDLEEADAQAAYEEQIGAGMAEGPDIILLQTFMDIEMMKIAARVAKQYPVPVFCAMTFEKVGRTLMGNSVKDVIDALTPLGVDAVGLNCSLGPDLALPVLQEFAANTDMPLLFKPNAGKPILAPDGTVATPYGADDFAREIAPALEIADYVGGCCGSDPSYISKIRQLMA